MNLDPEPGLSNLAGMDRVVADSRFDPSGNHLLFDIRTWTRLQGHDSGDARGS